MCQSCEALMINGVLCHEIGCPDAWRDSTRSCKWCGQEFKPDHRDEAYCTDDCKWENGAEEEGAA